MDLTDTSLFFFSSYSKRRKGEKRNWKKNDQRLPKKKRNPKNSYFRVNFSLLVAVPHSQGVSPWGGGAGTASCRFKVKFKGE